MSLPLTPAVRPRTESLNDVRAVIPPVCYERRAAPAAWALALAVVGLALTNRWWAVAVLWPLAGLGVSGLFVLGHDASHGALFRSPRANRVIARLCMAPSVHVEAAWDLGHNRIHHGYTTRQGFDFVWHPLTVQEYRTLGTLRRWRHRLEWSSLGSGAYFLRSVWWGKMWRFNPGGSRRRAVVRDKIGLGTVVVLAAAATVVYGAVTSGWVTALWLPVKLFVVPFLIFGQIIGWTVYVHHVAPDIRWSARSEWSQYRGQMESTTVLRLPAIVNRLWFHNIFVHVPHHVDTRIPFHQLKPAAAAIAAAFPNTVRDSRASIREYIRTTRACKLYDFQTGTWLRYAAARASS